LFPALLLTLVPLLAKDVRAFLRHASAKYDLGWTESHIDSLVEVVHGYPLGMNEVVQRELQRRSSMASFGATAEGDLDEATEEIILRRGRELGADDGRTE
jgi:hypothetical protein